MLIIGDIFVNPVVVSSHCCNGSEAHVDIRDDECREEKKAEASAVMEGESCHLQYFPPTELLPLAKGGKGGGGVIGFNVTFSHVRIESTSKL